MEKELKPINKEQYYIELWKLDKLVKTKKEKLKKQLKLFMSTCKHDYRYFPDPSGNNDSYNECRICGLID